MPDPTTANGLIYVPLRSACVGLIVADGVVVEVPPYVRRRRWVGRDAREVWRELRRGGVAVQWISDDLRSTVNS
jgi:hypothetical protein